MLLKKNNECNHNFWYFYEIPCLNRLVFFFSFRNTNDIFHLPSFKEKWRKNSANMLFKRLLMKKKLLHAFWLCDRKQHKHKPVVWECDNNNYLFYTYERTSNRERVRYIFVGTDILKIKMDHTFLCFYVP